ncbi:MAG: hypothetical protein ACPL7K_03025, partial [Armatimonadota bacterium]
MQSYPKAFNLYRHIIRTLGLIVFVTALVCGRSDIVHPAVGVFCLLVFLAELLPVRFPGTAAEAIMTLPVALSLFLSHGTSVMIIASTVAVTAAALIVHRKGYGLVRLLDLTSYHSSMYVLSVAVASLAYILAGGQILSEEWQSSPGWLYLVYCYTWVSVCTT